MKPLLPLLPSALRITGLLGCFLLAAATAHSATVGYWRFENAATSQAGASNDWLDDYSGNNLPLVPFGANPQPTQQVLPATGPASTFPLSVSRTGSDNDFSAKLLTNNSALRTTYDPEQFTFSTAFTLEAFVHPVTLTTTTGAINIIAGHYRAEASTHRRSYALSVNSSGFLEMILSSDGITPQRVTSTFSVQNGVDYYVAAAVTLGNPGSVTFYYQNLTAGGALQTQTVAHTVATLYNALTFFTIGGQGYDGSLTFRGYIDEVRVSNENLPASGLLVGPFLHVPTTTFTFTLPNSATTSAGVYDATGALVRTLWRAENYAAGVHVASWDNKDDLGATVANGAYTIKLVYHNVTYVWEGTIGNNSSSFTGTGVWKSSVTAKGILDMATDGTNLFAVKGHDEGKVPMFRATVADPMSVAGFMLFGANAQGSHWMGFRHVATDGVRVYVSSSLTGYDLSRTAFVMAMNASDGSRATFAGYGQVVNIAALNGQTGPIGDSAMYYSSAIDVTTNGPSPAIWDSATGLAVQKTGNVLAVAHDTLDVIKLYDKTTGQPLGTIPAVDVREIDFAPNGDLWGIHSTGSVSRWTGVGSTNLLVTTLTGLANPLSVAVHPSNDDMVYVADGGTSQQLKAFNRTGTLLWTFGVNGGYGTGSNIVQPTSATTARFDFKHGTYITAFTDGTLWIRDSGNYRNLHINPQPGAATPYIRQLMWMSPYIVGCDPNTPQRLFSNWLEFQVDYTKPLLAGDPDAPGGNGSWKLVRNWERALLPNIPLNATGSGFRSIVRLTNNRTYALASQITPSQLLVVELMADGSMRSTGVTLANNVRLYANGDLRYSTVAANVETIYKRTFAAFDGSGNPSWAAATVMASHPGNPATEPNGSASYGGVNFPLTTSGVLAVFDGTGGSIADFANHPKFRLGGVQNGGTSWLWKASPGVLVDSPPDKKGSFPHVSSASQVTGISVWAFGRSILYGYNGNANGADNQHKHFWDNGLFIGQFGVTTKENPNDTSIAGCAHNILTVTQVTVGGVHYYYTADEAAHAAVHRWRIDGISTIKDLSVSVNVGTSGLVNGTVYELEPWNALTKRLTVHAAGATSGTNVNINADINGTHQRWTALETESGSGLFELVPVHAPSLRLTVAAGGTASGTNVQIETVNGLPQQFWTAQLQTNGSYEMVPLNTPSMRLDVSGGGSGNGTNVQIYSDNNSNSQRWNLLSQ